jgi:hypothetical protein
MNKLKTYLSYTWMFASVMTCVFGDSNGSEEHIAELSEVITIEKNIQLKLKELKIHVVNEEKYHLEIVNKLMNEFDQYSDILELYANDLPRSYADFGITVDFLIAELDKGLNKEVKDGLMALDDAYWAIDYCYIPQELEELQDELYEKVNDLKSSNDSFKSIFMELFTLQHQIDDVIWEIINITDKS